MKTVLTLNTNRSGYSPSQIGHTMTVKQMIQKLEDYPEDMPVMFSNDNGYTYGEITEYDFDTIEDVEDEDEEEEYVDEFGNVGEGNAARADICV